MRKKIAGAISGVSAIIIYLIQRYVEINNMITPENSYLLLWGIGILAAICVVLLVWGFWKQILQILSNVRRLRLTLKPEQGYKNIGTRFVLKVPEEEQELLEFYDRQKENWHSYIQLKLVRVASHTKAPSPYLILTLEVHNYLPVDFKLVRVSETEGSVGQCNLPPLPENIDKKINACTEDQFEIKVGVHGTKIPEFLQSQEALGKPRLLQWYLKGVWYADIYGKIQPMKYKADALSCESLLSIME